MIIKKNSDLLNYSYYNMYCIKFVFINIMYVAIVPKNFVYEAFIAYVVYISSFYIYQYVLHNRMPRYCNKEAVGPESDTSNCYKR